MSKFYADQHRALQDRFDSRRMADFLEGGHVHTEFAPDEQKFIGKCDMFFLSTVDASGRPTVSYKGGAEGFVKVTGPAELIFPSYDGNGMFYSMGNIQVEPRVGLLFMDFEKPYRLRVQGSATIDLEHERLSEYPGAQFITTVAVESVWVNCSRYIHKYQKLGTSKYVPKAGRDAPFPAWKRLDIVQEALPEKDQGKLAEIGGSITLEQYAEFAAKGEG
ncbi:MAG: pyridoxamine 5'-phosphate oxidase family protein [Beijerinckiaceae bacterium]|nr:MAG: pyridoxamine 5'-phosphate oxidase family protein [Beijerinckiaceae bacterium]